MIYKKVFRRYFYKILHKKKPNILQYKALSRGWFKRIQLDFSRITQGT